MISRKLITSVLSRCLAGRLSSVPLAKHPPTRSANALDMGTASECIASSRTSIVGPPRPASRSPGREAWEFDPVSGSGRVMAGSRAPSRSRAETEAGSSPSGQVSQMSISPRHRVTATSGVGVGERVGVASTSPGICSAPAAVRLRSTAAAPDGGPAARARCGAFGSGEHQLGDSRDAGTLGCRYSCSRSRSCESGLMVTPMGSLPTGIVATTLLVPVSITETLLDNVFVT
jgi:hypothetical protein